MAAYGKMIYDCSRFVGDKALADDVHQIVFIEAKLADLSLAARLAAGVVFATRVIAGSRSAPDAWLPRGVVVE